MDLNRLHEIINATTIQLRKGMQVEGDNHSGITTVDIYDMPHVDDLKPGIETVDMEFVVIGVKKDVAEGYREELIEILKTYPQPERLKGGPSYIEVGAEIGDQGAAFQLFALGKVLELWNVITPAFFGMKGMDAQQFAGSGGIMITGFDVAA